MRCCQVCFGLPLYCIYNLIHLALLLDTVSNINPLYLIKPGNLSMESPCTTVHAHRRSQAAHDTAFCNYGADLEEVKFFASLSASNPVLTDTRNYHFCKHRYKDFLVKRSL